MVGKLLESRGILGGNRAFNTEERHDGRPRAGNLVQRPALAAEVLQAEGRDGLAHGAAIVGSAPVVVDGSAMSSNEQTVTNRMELLSRVERSRIVSAVRASVMPIADTCLTPS